MNVLIIAGEEHLRRGYCAIAKLYGHEVYTAVEPGLDYSTIIMDIGDNLELNFRKIKGVHFDKLVFVVSDKWCGGVPAGTSGVLIKPITAEALESFF